MNSMKKAVSRGLTICSIALFSLGFSSVVAVNSVASQAYQTQELQLSEAELAQLLAPIALYPDSLLSHIMIASTYPLEIVEAYRWQQDNSHLAPADAVEKAEQEGWDPSVTALVAFVNVLERLNDDLRWTQTLGDAFLADEGAVLNTIQALRLEADKADSLSDMPHMRVVKQQQQIIIEPVNHSIVYVPYYDTRVVYGNWRWHRYPPVHWRHRPYASVHFPVNVSARFHWGAGININFNYFFSAFSWHNRHVVVTRHHKTRHYRPYQRIVSSHGAKRWQHKVHHRRGVAYRTHKYARNKGHAGHNKYARNNVRFDNRSDKQVKRALKHPKAQHKPLRNHEQLQKRIKRHHDSRVQPKQRSRDYRQGMQQTGRHKGHQQQQGELHKARQYKQTPLYQKPVMREQKSRFKHHDVARQAQKPAKRSQPKRSYNKQTQTRKKVRSNERKRN